MADVRRPVTWEDLGCRQDRATGRWTEARLLASVSRALGEHRLADGICASCGPARTWEDVGFTRDRTGRWIDSAVRAKHRFDPSLHPHDPHNGEFVGTPGGAAGALADELDLAGRIHLLPGERLVSSSRLQDSSGADVDLLFAVVASPYGHEVRIGAIPSDDAEKWSAEAKGATAGLSADELRQARTELAAAAKAADKAAEAADAAWESGHPPTDPKLLGTKPLATGQLISANHDDLDWEIRLDDNSNWELTIAPTRGEFDGAVLDSLDTEALLMHLGDIQRQLDNLD